MKVNEPLIENIKVATEAYEAALDVIDEQKSAMEDLKDNVSSYMSYDGDNRKVIKGEDFIQCFIDNYDQEVDRELVSEHLSKIIDWFDEDEVFGTRRLGQAIDTVDSDLDKSRRHSFRTLNDLESFRAEIQEDYEPGSRHFSDDWTPSDSYIGNDDAFQRPDIELFQSNLSDDNLRETSIADRLEKLDEAIDYLDGLVACNQQIIDEETVEANEAFYEDEADFNFPILDGLLESLRIARTEKQGLEHFLIHNDEHDYLLQRWSKELEHDLFGSGWKIYGEEVDYFEDEPLTEKNQLSDSEAVFWRDGEFDLLLKNGGEYAYVEVKSYDKGEETAKEQLKRIEDHDSVLIKNGSSYERIDTGDVKKFWINQKPRFDVDYSQKIDDSSDEIVRLDEPRP